jgi:hypothetical protein
MPSDDDEDFNIDATPHWVDMDHLEFDSPAELIEAIRRDGVRFDATGNGAWAAEPDGSHVVDYRTGEQEAVTWHLPPGLVGPGNPSLITTIFIIAFVDAEIVVRPNEYGGQSVVRKAARNGLVQQAVERQRVRNSDSPR